MTNRPNRINNRDRHFGIATLDRLYHRAVRAQRRRREKSEVGCFLKHFLFSLNVIFMILGLIIMAIGVWAWTEKSYFTNLKNFTHLAIDPVLFFVIIGMLFSSIGFLGCFGALRENTTMLMLFCVTIGIIFCLEAIVCVLTFVYKDWMIDQIKLNLKTILVNYRENIDLRDLIDWVQEIWLLCCGIDSPNDWDLNMYFNCSSPSSEKCGVPPSCCKSTPKNNMRNLLCGRMIRDKSMNKIRNERIYTIGCVFAGQKWIENNIISVAGVLVGIAILQIIVICLAQHLRGDIFAQMAKWRTPGSRK